MNVSSEHLESLRGVGDHPADQLMQTLTASHRMDAWMQILPLPAERLRKARMDKEMAAFLKSPRPLPDWWDDSRLLRGQLVFRQCALDVMMLLGAMSLPYCYAASPGNKALYRAGKMRKQTAKRLFDTAQFVMAVLTPGSLAPRGDGYLHINKTRLIHAMVRQLVSRHDWDSTWGLPVNQEDMAGTNLAFSYVILLGLQQSGVQLHAREREDFLFAWRCIGYQMGVDESLLPASFEEARRLEYAIRKRHFKKSEEGIELMNDLLQYFKGNFPPVPAYFIDSQIRYFLGPEIYPLLGLKPEPLKDNVRVYLSAIREAMNTFMINPGSYDKLMARSMAAPNQTPRW